MPTDLENLETRRTAICTELAAMDATKAGGLPYSSAEQIKHVEYRLSLYKELCEIDATLASIQGPFEVETLGLT